MNNILPAGHHLLVTDVQDMSKTDSRKGSIKNLCECSPAIPSEKIKIKLPYTVLKISILKLAARFEVEIWRHGSL